MRTGINLLLILILFSSCKKCYDEYCIGNLPFYFDITDASGIPLDRNIPLDSIPVQLYYIENGAKQMADLQRKQSSDGLDTMYVSNYSVGHTRYYIEFQQQPSDTLDLEYEKNETDCCGDEYSVVNVVVNGMPSSKVKGVYQLQLE